MITGSLFSWIHLHQADAKSTLAINIGKLFLLKKNMRKFYAYTSWYMLPLNKKVKPSKYHLSYTYIDK